MLQLTDEEGKVEGVEELKQVTIHSVNHSPAVSHQTLTGFKSQNEI